MDSYSHPSKHVWVLESQTTNSSTDSEKGIVPTENVTPGKRNRLVASSRKLMSSLSAWAPSEDTLYNAVLGVSDGMTVPFAVTASLAGVADAKLVMLAGLAELISGSISMAAGGILGTRCEVQKYKSTRETLEEVLFTHPNRGGAQTRQTQTINEDLVHSFIHEAFSHYLPPALLREMTRSLCSTTSSLTRDQQLDFLLQFADPHSSLPRILANKNTPPTHVAESPFTPPTTSGAWKIALVLGLAYFSGLIPLIPYIAVPRDQVMHAFWISVAVTIIMLTAFGYGKTALVLKIERLLPPPEDGRRSWRKTWMCVKGAAECLGVVGLSAGISVVVIRGIGGTL